MTLFYGERLDIQQPDKGYKMSIDAILLAAAVTKGQSFLDVGSGVGTASLCLAHRYPTVHITGIEIQEQNVTYAKKNAIHNHLNIEFICEDISTHRLTQTFDHILSNPPFFEKHKINKPQNKHKLLSHVLHDITLEQWLHFCIKYSKEYVTIIHLPEYLPQILNTFSKSLGGIKIYPIWTNNIAKRIIIQGSKKSKAALVLHKGLILQNKLGLYTPEAEDILKYAKEISL